jgi:hypothetical protein
VLNERVSRLLHLLEADLRETDHDLVATCTTGLPAGQTALALPSARDSSGAFCVSGSYEPDWQAVVIYCHYQTDSGVDQLRRYVYYDSSFRFPFQFVGPNPITDDDIHLEDALGRTLTVDRRNGNTSLPAGRDFRALCPGTTMFGWSAGDPSAATVAAESVARGALTLNAEATLYVADRN